MTNGALFFLQLFVIVGTCRTVGWLIRRYLGQPHVVGEMIAGVILGPTVLGVFAPDLQQVLFPERSKDVLYVLGQLGICLYMFLIGLGFRRDQFKTHARSAAALSIAGMGVPFIAAAVISPWLFGIPGLFAGGVSLFQATLFLGAAISITAFPMLARIIDERGLGNTPLGTLSLSAGAVADLGAWAVLAIVLASFGDRPSSAVMTLVGGLGFAAFMLSFGTRLTGRLARIADQEDRLSHGLLSTILLLLLVCAFVTELIGIHAVLGSFVLGLVVPRGLLADALKRKLEPIVVVFLLPVFFTFSGLHTQLALIGSGEMFLVAGMILAVSILAKGGACWLAARLTGQDNATALAIGALMNARGLMELILINIGLQRGIIEAGLFSILVLMAIVTTLMAAPLLALVHARQGSKRGDLAVGDDSARAGGLTPTAADRPSPK